MSEQRLEQAKALLVSQIGADAVLQICEWQGTHRVPQQVTLETTAQTKQVEYMRDGIIVFTDYTTALYERVIDDPASPVQSIVLAYKR